MPIGTTSSGIRDNHRRVVVADFLKAKIHHGSRLSVVSAYFTICAYDALRGHLDQIDHLDLLFGEPRFIASLDLDKTEKKSFILDGNGLQLANRLEQKRVARDCAEWVRNKVDKRLESSVKSFEITMGRTIGKIEALEKKIHNFIATPDQNPETDELELDIGDAGQDEELEQALLVGGKFKYKLEHLELDSGKNWLKDLKKDRDQLRILFSAAQNVTPDTDAKLLELKKLIAAKVANPATNKLGQPNKKVLVFTAFADTAAYLFDSLRSWAEKDLGVHIALVTGGGGNHTTFGKTDYNQILTNFSPRSKNRAKIPSLPQDGEIDLLIATDCIPGKLLRGSFTRHESDLYSTLKVNEDILLGEPLLRAILDVLTWSGASSMGQCLLCAILDIKDSSNAAAALSLGVGLRLLQKNARC